MTVHYTEPAEHSEPTQRPKNAPLPLTAWLDVAPVAWLMVVISAYGLLAWVDMVPTKRPVPGIPEADRLALPFLVLTVSAGIIRYFCLRAQERKANAASASPDLGRRDIA
jgi:hypothetical protein